MPEVEVNVVDTPETKFAEANREIENVVGPLKTVAAEMANAPPTVPEVDSISVSKPETQPETNDEPAIHPAIQAKIDELEKRVVQFEKAAKRANGSGVSNLGKPTRSQADDLIYVERYLNLAPTTDTTFWILGPEDGFSRHFQIFPDRPDPKDPNNVRQQGVTLEFRPAPIYFAAIFPGQMLLRAELCEHPAIHITRGDIRGSEFRLPLEASPKAGERTISECIQAMKRFPPVELRDIMSDAKFRIEVRSRLEEAKLRRKIRAEREERLALLSELELRRGQIAPVS